MSKGIFGSKIKRYIKVLTHFYRRGKSQEVGTKLIWIVGWEGLGRQQDSEDISDLTKPWFFHLYNEENSCIFNVDVQSTQNRIRFIITSAVIVTLYFWLMQFFESLILNHEQNSNNSKWLCVESQADAMESTTGYFIGMNPECNRIQYGFTKKNAFPSQMPETVFEAPRFWSP